MSDDKPQPPQGDEDSDATIAKLERRPADLASNLPPAVGAICPPRYDSGFKVEDAALVEDLAFVPFQRPRPPVSPLDPPYVPPSLRQAERHRQGRAAELVTGGSPRRTDPTYDIDNIFTYHPPIGDQPQRYAALRAKAKEYAALILKLVPSSAERTLALRRLEEASFWSNAAIGRNEGQGEGAEE